MKSNPPLYLQILKYLIAVIAVINLVVLFLFPSGLPFLINMDDFDAFGSVAAEGSSSPDAEMPQYTIALESDTITYDGSGELDLLDGVSLIGPDGKAINQTIFVHIKTGDTISQKIIEYTADTEDGQVSTTRGLELSDYSGPSLQLPEELPTIEDNELDSILDTLLADDDFYADDGYGNDITQSVAASYTRDEDDPYLAHYVFTVENSFNDSTAASADISITPRPIITLTDSVITVPLNASFSELSYVASAVDTDGSSLMRNIIIDGDVDTSVPGEYTLTYILHSPSGVFSNPAELKVIVE